LKKIKGGNMKYRVFFRRIYITYYDVVADCEDDAIKDAERLWRENVEAKVTSVEELPLKHDDNK